MEQFERLQDQLSRVKSIMGNKNMRHCECGFSYIPMNSILDHLCPNCQKDELAELGIEID